MNFLFAYGILQDPAILAALTGRELPARAATLADHRALCVRSASYPGLIAAAGHTVAGSIYGPLTEAEWMALDNFEGESYQRVLLAVEMADGTRVNAGVYRFDPAKRELLDDADWHFANYAARVVDPAHLTCRMNPYADPRAAKAIVDILQSYATDPRGGGSELSAYTREHLVEFLAARPWVRTWVCFYEELPVGVLIAVEGISSFAAMPLMNFHDIAVLPGFRGRGIGTTLIRAAETFAREHLGACKLTLEVLANNTAASRLYARLGFEPYRLDPQFGNAEFWHKTI